MTKEELMDILGEVSDKFYAEAMEEEPLQAELITVNKAASKGRIFRIAAGTAAGVAAAVGITAAVIKYNTNDLYSITNENIEYCKNYIAEISEEDVSGFAYRILDLNFDEKEELLLMSEEYSSPLYIFKNTENGMELTTVLGEGADRAYMPSLDGMYPFEGENERYYYYSFSFDNGGVMEARVAAALKYNEENDYYYTENLLSYGMLSYEGTALPASVFYRKGWDPQDILPTGYPEDMEEEPFRELWRQYEELPAISFEDFRQKDSTSVLTPQAQDICDKYIKENYSEKIPYFSELSYYTKDLNFDGRDEIIAIGWFEQNLFSGPLSSVPPEPKCPLFIFEQTDGVPVFNCLLGDDGNRAFIDEGIFASLTPYEQNGEKYYYYYFTTNNGGKAEPYAIVNSKVTGSIKYDGEKYYTEYLLSYGTILGGDAGTTEVFFFRDDWNVDILSIEADNSTLSYEEFRERWNEYDELPPVDFSDISIYNGADEHVAFVYNDVMYDYAYNSEPYLIDENRNVTDLDGNETWETFGSETAEAMLQFDSLEYQGNLGSMKINNVHIGNGSYHDIEMYQYGDKMLALWNPPAEEQSVWFEREIEYDTSEFYIAYLFEPCLGHKGDITAFSPSQIPDVEGGGYMYKKFTDIEKANYSAMYHSFKKTVLYREEEAIGGYEFWLIGEEVRTNKKTDPDKMYCSDLYVLVWKGDEMITRINVSAKTLPELPINGDYSDFSVQAYQLRDGLVIFTPCEETSGYCSPFLTITDDGGNDKLHVLYGDFSALLERYDDYSKLKQGVEFTADDEENTLFYGSTAFKFDFSKVGKELDENGNVTECFTVYETE